MQLSLKDNLPFKPIDLSQLHPAPQNPQEPQPTPSILQIDTKKPFLKFARIQSSGQNTEFIAYDRYRFKIVSEKDGGKEQVWQKKLEKVMSEIVYLNFQEPEQILLLMTVDKRLFIYSFKKSKFLAEGLSLPSHIYTKIVIDDSFKASVNSLFQSNLNKMQSGLPKFKLLNHNMNQNVRNFGNGNQFEMTYYPEGDLLVLVSQKLGTFASRLTGKGLFTCLKPGDMNSLCHQTFLLSQHADVYVGQRLLLLQNSKMDHQAINIKQRFKLEQSYFKDIGIKDNLSFIAKEDEAEIEIMIPEGMFRGLEGDQHPYVSEFHVCSHVRSLKSLVAINLHGSFELYMVDFRHKQRVTNLLKTMNNQLLTSTRGSHVFSIDINQTAGLFTVATTNLNFLCFNADTGEAVEAKSVSLYNQSVTPNRKLFLQNLFGGKDRSIDLAEGVYSVKIDASEQGKAHIFDGRKISSIQVTIGQPYSHETAVARQEPFNLIQFIESHPYMIDHGMTIFANNDIYVNYNKQIVNALRDSVRLLKLRQVYELSFDQERILGDFHPNLFSRQILINTFNQVLSLVSQNNVFEASLVVSLQNQVLLESNAEARVRYMIPHNFVLPCRGDRAGVEGLASTKFEKISVITSQGSAEQTSTIVHRPYLKTYQQNELAALLPIFKILLQIKNNNEDESFRNLIAQSESLAQSHRLKIVKAHAMIKHFRDKCCHLHCNRPSKTFIQMLDQLYCQEAMYGTFEPGQMYAFYDMFRHKSVKNRDYVEEQPNSALFILNGIYGSPFVSFSENEGRYSYAYSAAMFRESLSLFAAEYEQLKTFEYYLFVQVYGRVLKSAFEGNKLNVEISLPKLSKALESWQFQSFINLDQLQMVPGQTERRRFNLDFVEQEKCSLYWLHIAMQTYLGKSKYMLEQINCFEIASEGLTTTRLQELQQLLFLAKLFREIRYSEKIEDKSNNSFFLHILKLTLNPEEIQSNSSTVKRPTSLSLKLGLSTLSYAMRKLQLMDPIAPQMVHSEKIFMMLVKKAQKSKAFVKEKLPKILLYTLQNFNQISLEELKKRQKATFPLGQSPKAVKFLLESMAMFIDTHQVCISIRKNEVIQSPDIATTLLESIRLEEYEEKTHKKAHGNHMSYQEDENLKKQLNQVKMSIWRFVLTLWYFQCLFMVENNPDEDAEAWKIRKLAIKKCLRLPEEERAEQSDHSLYAIYFSDGFDPERSGNSVLHFVAKALVDSEFNSFAHQLPKILKYYAASQREEIYDKQAVYVESIIQSKYRQVYDQFRAIFGLKLNYSVRLTKEKGQDQLNGLKIQLIKRCPKAWFKTTKPFSFDAVLGTALSTKPHEQSRDSASASVLNRSTFSGKLARNAGIGKSNSGQSATILVEEKTPSPQEYELVSDPERLLEQLRIKQQLIELDYSQPLSHNMAIQTSYEQLVPKTERQEPAPRADAFVQTSGKNLKASRSQSSSEKKDVSNQDGPLQHTILYSESAISPQKRIDQQLLELDREQMINEIKHQGKVKNQVIFLTKSLQSKLDNHVSFALKKLLVYAESAHNQARFEEKAKNETLSATNNQTLWTNDRTRMLSIGNVDSISNKSPGAFGTITHNRPSGAIFEEPSIILGQLDSRDGDMEEIRQSKSFRGPVTSQKENDKIMYYHLNNRLQDKEQRNLTPQRGMPERLEQTQKVKKDNAFKTIDHGDDGHNTSRFGDDKNPFFSKNRDRYYKKRGNNVRTINEMENNFDILSGHSSNNFSRVRSHDSPEGKEDYSGREQDRKSSPSGLSDHSRLTKFLYPKEHIQDLGRQKSPLRRSNSAKYLRNMIQGGLRNQSLFYKPPRKSKCTITDNLIKFNQRLMQKDFEKTKEQKPYASQRSQRPTSAAPLSVIPGIIGTQVKIMRNNFTTQSNMKSAIKSPAQIQIMMDNQAAQVKKEIKQQRIKFLRFKNAQ